MLPVIFFIIILIVILLYIWSMYNTLVVAKTRVDESYSGIDVQLKKRYDLLPDLVETAKRAAALDEKILIEITRLRSQAMEASQKGQTADKRAEVENKLSTLMRDVKVQIENYPNIKAHQELSLLMDRVTDIEEKIAYARQFYNTNVQDYNRLIQSFPNVFLAQRFNFEKIPYFQAEEAEKKDIKVKFD